MKSFHSIIVFLLLFPEITLFGQGYEYGLRIKTFPSPPSEFTGLLLEGGEAFHAKGNLFRMDFSLSNRKDNVFGLVFRIITDKGYNVDLMYTVGLDGNHYPILVTGEYVHDISADIPMGEWIPVSISLNTRKGVIAVNYNGTSLIVNEDGIKGTRNFRVAFGHCPITGYVLDDVASVDLRDITIWQKDELTRHWDLSVHDKNICFDKITQSASVAENPEWIVDQYISWEDVYEINFTKEPSLAFDPKGTFYMTSKGENIISYDLNEGAAHTINVKDGEFPTNAPNQLIFSDRLIAYNLDESTGAYFDFDSQSWVGGKKSTKDHDYWNNASAFWKEEQAIVCFGGYGHYRYNNKLLLLYPFDHSKDKCCTLSSITPRYGCAVSIVGDKMYIFGGRGNLSGKQELSPKYYYELYSVDLNTQEVKKIWELDDIQYHFTLGEQMIWDKDSTAFYVFANYDNGVLLKFDAKTGEMEYASLPSGIVGGSQYQCYNIFLNEEGTKLFLTSTNSQYDGSSKVSIKSLNWPPLSMKLSKVSVVTEKNNEEEGANWNIVITLALICVALVCILIIQRRTRRKTTNKGHNVSVDLEKETAFYDFSKNSICFFGGFTVKDRDGKDITYQFTPNLKALTILLLLHSANESPGISSGKLNRTLWYYKPEEAANNNRNVYISKLRTIFESLDGFTITNKNKLWNIVLSDGAQCDWIHVKTLMNRPGSEENISHIIELLLRGAMLPNSEFDWLDTYKGDFSNFTIDTLSRLLDSSISDEMKIKVANTIFMHDPLNEDALVSKCRILYKSGKTGLAKYSYDTFCKEYKASLGMNFKEDFKQIIDS